MMSKELSFETVLSYLKNSAKPIDTIIKEAYMCGQESESRRWEEIVRANTGPSGEMPDAMWKLIQGNRAATTAAIKFAVGIITEDILEEAGCKSVSLEDVIQEVMLEMFPDIPDSFASLAAKELNNR